MTHLTSHMAALFGVAVLVAGCASAPQAPQNSAAPAPADPLDCRQLAAEITRAQSQQRDAQEKEANAWKAVIPFAVAARYVQGKAAGADAAEQLAKLRAESLRKGCGRHGQ